VLFLCTYGSEREDFNERPYVFRFCATKSLNSKKPWKKGKIICVFFCNGIVVGRYGKSSQFKGRGWASSREEQLKKITRVVFVDDSSTVDGDKPISKTLSIKQH